MSGFRSSVTVFVGLAQTASSSTSRPNPLGDDRSAVLAVDALVPDVSTALATTGRAFNMASGTDTR